MMARSSAKGFTLIEMMVVIAMVVIFVGVGLPTFLDVLDRRRISDAAEALARQAQQARAVAQDSSRSISLVFDGEDSAWCYGLTFRDNCDCNQTLAGQSDSCEIPLESGLNLVGTDLELVRDDSSQFTGVTLEAAPANVRFEPLRGLRLGPPGDVTIVLRSARGLEARIAINEVGRVAVCSPDGATRVMSMREC